MAASRILTAAAFFITFLCVVSASQNISKTGRKATKKVDDMVNDMYTAFMMTKNVMGMMLMFVSPIIQIKGFGLSVINTLINIGRFMLQMHTTKRLQEMTQMHHVSGVQFAPHVFHADHKVLTGEPKHPIINHMDHEEQHKVHDSSVYIIKDHDQDSWRDGNPNHELTNNHDIIWTKDPDNYWETTDSFYSAPNNDQKWSSSQKFPYYAPPPATPFSRRVGLPSPPPSFPQNSLSPAQASYVSGDVGIQLFPYYRPNITRFR